MHQRPRAAVWLVALMIVGCGRTEESAPPVATPSVTLQKKNVTLGSPVAIQYRFLVANDAPAIDGDYWVFVHFLDRDGELMWTDDHRPPTPTEQWKPGQTIEYERTMFVPKFPYTGPTTVEVGLFSPKTGQRLPMTGQTRGQRSYQVAAFDLQLQSESQYIVFKDGWHPAEVADDQVGTEWQWSKKEATLAFRNPKKDVVFYLQLDRPAAPFPEPQQVDVRIGEQVVDSFPLAAHQTELRKISLTPAQLGTGDTVEMRIVVDRTFIPAAVPSMSSRDARELGVRVFRAYVETR
jgi:hypothetical protein